jgi:hypothetical protein
MRPRFLLLLLNPLLADSLGAPVRGVDCLDPSCSSGVDLTFKLRFESTYLLPKIFFVTVIVSTE